MAFLRGKSRSKLVLIGIQVLLLFGLLAGLSTLGFIEYSAQPSFCTNCHNMKPYYESWASSSHNDVPCIKCHYAPGIKAEAMGKVQAANQVVKYVTGSYGTRPWAEIEDAACLRSGCHSTRKLEGELVFSGVRFNHRQHLIQLRRGKQLRCTSCHSQIVQGEHLAVTKETCFLCHFRGQPPGEPIAGCTGCHSSPPRLEVEGRVIDHPQYVADMVSCVSCHDRVTSGTGAADQDRCYVCHNLPERLAEYENTTLIHEVHLTEHNVECQLCHRPIDHAIVSLSDEFDLDCKSCHEGSHVAQQRMFTGTGAHGTGDDPSAMFLARVTCQSCHRLPRELVGHENVKAAGEAACLSCHGIRYANILPGWQAEAERKLDRVAKVVDAASGSRRRGSETQRAAADSLLELARGNVELVRVGKGVHNVEYADATLRAALQLVREASESGGIDYQTPEVDLGQPVSENQCLRCHSGIEDQRGEWRGRSFRHEPHVTRANLSCTFCHTSMDDHGKISLASPEICSDCHHSGAMACERCHEGTPGPPGGVIRTGVGDFPHARHTELGFDCAMCHGNPPTRPGADLCERCHGAHHQPEVRCLACHREGVKAIHPPVVHQGCAICHGEAVAGIDSWSRNVCTVCHDDRVDHYAPNDCVACHPQPPLGSDESS
ncbi:MAG: cytochrome c3 family protein [Candidatus Palauibacterales bacterium]|nr:cytochrome c3 family protein [Candidatus Palauibacterales bacterium]MDP2482432.1 cytochrome c3 family protein [Candidatus Palauibacterales bacterium]